MPTIKTIHHNKVIAPKLRFKGFVNKWETKSLGSLLSVKSGLGFKAQEYTNEGIRLLQIENVSYGRIKWNENTVFLPIDYLNKYPELHLKENDVVIALNRPVTNNQLKISKIKKMDEPSILYQRVGKLIIKEENTSKDYIYQIFARDVKKFVLTQSIGSDQPFISINALYKLKLNIPTLPEQQKIASFLSAVDEKIQLLNRKKLLLEQYKKGVMQQLFSGKLRFKDENGKVYPKWEEKKLGDVLEIGSGRDYKHLGEGTIPVFGTGGLMTTVDKFLYDGETVCIGRKGTIDKPMYYNGKIWTVDTLFYTHKFRNSIPKFIYFLFQQINWRLYNEASGVPSLSKATIEKLKFSFPSEPEQKKIADFLSAIDVKIESLSNQISQTQTFKKGLLQQMFV
jgi:type I restriction enzyme S subunit